MITVSTRKLVSAIEEADVFHLPDRNEGTRYIYDEIYKRSVVLSLMILIP